MILADKILNLRKKNGWSQDELADKLNVSRQSVSKWEGALSIPDISKIIEMANLFEVSTDYLLKDDMEVADYVEGKEADEAVKLTVQDANALCAANDGYSFKMAFGVALCILSPLILFLMLAINTLNGLISENLAIGLGTPAIFVFVASAVAIFISLDKHSKKLAELTKKGVKLDYGVEGIIKEKREAYSPVYTRSIIIGVCLCMMCAVPYIVAAACEAPDYVYLFIVAAMFVLIAVGVYLMVITSCKKTLYDLLLQEENYAPEKRAGNRKTERVAGIYWPIVTAGYLLWSFITDDWHISWIVWPVAAVLFGAISAIFQNVKNK